jgi:hypothetical protein
MALNNPKLGKLRQLIQENLRIQRGGGALPPYIDVSNALPDIKAKQNHTVFARRGCGKTLLLHHSANTLDESVKSVYLNCEDFKHHSFPNVLIEILDALFAELESHLTGWFGKKKKSRELIQKIRSELAERRKAADRQEEAIRAKSSAEEGGSTSAQLRLNLGKGEGQVGIASAEKASEEVERTFKIQTNKIRDLDMWLPRLKEQVREFFAASGTVKAVFLQIDDFYHLKRSDQPFVIDYIHRLCKDVPLYFKIATLRHVSTLYADRKGQPIGAQERHDYQPINIDYTFQNFRKTRDQNMQILKEFGRLSGVPAEQVDALFKGEGFDRLVMAGGGVPRDVLSLFLEVLSEVSASGGDRIGKDEVRILSRANFERRIEELKFDSEGQEQDALLRGIYVLREFCLNRQTSVFLVSERLLQQRDDLRTLIYRLLDYRIIHNAAQALTHKSQQGTYQAFAIDIGCYAHLRKHQGRFNELDLSSPDAKEQMRSAPVLDENQFQNLWSGSPKKIEDALVEQEQETA